MLRTVLVNNLKGFKPRSEFNSYLEHISKRPFPNVDEEWQQTIDKYGEHVRVHSDSKAIFRGQWTLWVMRGRGAEGEPPKRILSLLKGEQYHKENILVSADVSNVDNFDVLDGSTFKQSLKEMFEEAGIDVDQYEWE